MLVIIYHMFREENKYADLGGDFFDHLQPKHLARYYLARLERLGYKVSLEARTAAA